jgi:hypothetical protein
MRGNMYIETHKHGCYVVLISGPCQERKAHTSSFQQRLSRLCFGNTGRSWDPTAKFAVSVMSLYGLGYCDCRKIVFSVVFKIPSFLLRHGKLLYWIVQNVELSPLFRIIALSQMAVLKPEIHMGIYWVRLLSLVLASPYKNHRPRVLYSCSLLRLLS